MDNVLIWGKSSVLLSAEEWRIVQQCVAQDAGHTVTGKPPYHDQAYKDLWEKIASVS